MALPGVKIGPLDPDRTSQFGQVSAHNSARTLIRLHMQMHPAELRQALSKPLDPERTKGLDLDEVRDYLGGQELENGDPLVPEGAEVVAASVRGKPDRPQVLCFTYETPSGRTGKWFAPYTVDELPESVKAGQELARVQEMKDRGIVSWDDQGHATEVLRREAAELRRQNKALRNQLEHAPAQDDGELPAEPEGDTRPAVVITEQNDQLAVENAELRARLTELEALTRNLPVPGVTPPAPRDSVASADEPVEGYDDLNAADAIKLLRSDDTDAETRARILQYEETHANRRTVVAAGHAAD